MGKTQRGLLIYGAGGHGKVLAGIAISAGQNIAGVVDDSRTTGVIDGLNVKILGDRAWLLRQPRDLFNCVLAIGDNSLRLGIGEFLAAEGFEIATLISPFAVVSPSCGIGKGTVIMPGAVINPLATLAEGVIVNTGAIVEHDSKVGRYANLSPNSTLGGGVEIGDLAHVAIGATVMPGLRVGARSTLGAGSVATRSVPDDCIAYGVPARVQRRI